MLNAIKKKVLAAKVPSTEIAGVTFTHDEANQLLHTCNALQNTLKAQVSVIADLFEGPNSGVTSKTRIIQTHHIDIQVLLERIVNKTHSSKAAWVHEFSDAISALEHKIVGINRDSRKTNWVTAACEGWPRVAETYTWLLPLAVKLCDELTQSLSRDELWALSSSSQNPGTGDTQHEEPPVTQMVSRHVRFNEKVIVREWPVGSSASEQGTEQASYVKLRDRGKAMRKLRVEISAFASLPAGF